MTREAMVGTLRFAHPTDSTREHEFKWIVIPARQPYRGVANLRNISRKIMAGAFFAGLLTATHSP
jgi:hypothetical protein